MARKKNPTITLSEDDRQIIEDAVNDARQEQRAAAVKQAKAHLKAGDTERARKELEIAAAIDSEEPFYLTDLPIDWKEPEAE